MCLYHQRDRRGLRLSRAIFLRVVFAWGFDSTLVLMVILNAFGLSRHLLAGVLSVTCGANPIVGAMVKWDRAWTGRAGV